MIGALRGLRTFYFFKGKVKGVCGNKITSNYLNRRRRYMADILTIRRKTLYNKAMDCSFSKYIVL